MYIFFWRESFNTINLIRNGENRNDNNPYGDPNVDISFRHDSELNSNRSDYSDHVDFQFNNDVARSEVCSGHSHFINT